MRAHSGRQRALAIDPTSRGFGFVVLESGGRLVDWGKRQARAPDRNDRCVAAVRVLTASFTPTHLALEDWTGPGSRRCPRVRRLLRRLRAEAIRRGIRPLLIAPAVARQRLGLSSRATKHDLASELASRFPELEPQLPTPRKTWQSEDPRTALFDALALAVAGLEPRKIVVKPRAP